MTFTKGMDCQGFFFKLFRVELWTANLPAAESSVPSSSFQLASYAAYAWGRIDALFAGLASRSTSSQTNHPCTWFTLISNCQTIFICFMPCGHLQCQITKSLCKPGWCLRFVPGFYVIAIFCIFYLWIEHLFSFWIVLTQVANQFCLIKLFFMTTNVFHKNNVIFFNHF